MTQTDLARLITLPDREILVAGTSGLEERAALFCQHRFDILGSGWVGAGYGGPAAGLRYQLDRKVESGPVYGPAPAPRIDPAGLWLGDRVAAEQLRIADAHAGEGEPDVRRRLAAQCRACVSGAA